MPMRGPVATATSRQPSSRSRSSNGGSASGARFISSPIPSASVSFPGPEQSSRARITAAAPGHLLDAPTRLQRPDQHRGGSALGLADEVETGVDPVGEVDVRAPGRPEQRCGSLRQPDVRMAGGIVALVALDLHDHAANSLEQQRAADQVAGDVVHRAIEEADGKPARGGQPRAHRRMSSRATRAASSCSASRVDAVPPGDIFDSSHWPERSTS